MKIDNKYNIGDEVYLTTDSDQYKRIVTGIRIRPGGLLMYMVTCGETETDHYDFELSTEKTY